MKRTALWAHLLCLAFVASAVQAAPPDLIQIRRLAAIDDEADLPRARELVAGMDASSAEAPAILKVAVCHVGPRLGLVVALDSLGGQGISALIDALRDDGCDNQAANALLLLGEPALPTLRGLTADPDLGALVAQIIELIEDSAVKSIRDIEHGPRAPALEIVPQSGHGGGVELVLATPDESRLITVGRDRIIKVWDLADLSVISALGPIGGLPDDAVYDADRRLLYVSAEQSLTAWDIERGLRKWELALDNRLGSIALSADGHWLLGEVSANIVRGVDVVDLERRRLVPVHRTEAKEDGTYEGLPGTFHISFFARFEAGSRAVIFGNGPGGESVGKRARRFDLKTEVVTEVRPIEVRELPYSDISVSADGETAVGLAGKDLVQLDVATGRPLRRVGLGAPLDWVSVHDSRHVFVGSHQYDPEWRPDYGKIIELGPGKGRSIPLPSGGLIYLPRRQMLIGRGLYHGEVRLYSPRLELIHEIPAAVEPASAVALSPESAVAAIGFSDRALVELWDTEAGAPAGSVPSFKDVTGVAFLPGERLLIQSRVGTLEEWHLRGEEPFRERLWAGLVMRSRTLAVSPSGRRSAVRGTVESRMAKGVSQEELDEWAAARSRPMVRLTPVGEVLTIPKSFEDLSVVDLTSGETVRTLEGYRYDVSALHFAAEDELLIGGPGWYGLWRLGSERLAYVTGLSQAEIPGAPSAGEVSDAQSFTVNKDAPLYLALASDRRRDLGFAAGGHNEITAFDLSTGTERWRVPFRSRRGVVWVNSLEADSATGRLLSAHSDGKIRLWDMETGALVASSARESSGLVDVAAAWGRGFVLTAGADGAARAFGSSALDPLVALHRFEDGEWLAHDCQGRYASSPEGSDRLAFRVGRTVLRFDRLAATHRAPEAVENALRTGVCPRSVTAVPLPARLGATLRARRTGPTGTTAEITVKADEPLGEIFATNNGAMVAEQRFDGNGARSATLRVPLRARQNQILVTGRSVSGVLTNEVRLPVGGRDRAPGRPAMAFVGIAVGDYGGDGDLPFAVADVHRTADALQSRENARAFEVSSATLTNRDVTASRVLSTLASLSVSLPDDGTTMIHVSGHGSIEDGEPALLVRTEQGGIAPLALSRLYEAVGRLPGTVVVILDLCHSGATIADRAGVTAEAVIESLKERRAVSPILFVASKGREKAHIDPRAGGSVFAITLARALRGEADLYPRDGVVSLSEMYRFVQRETRAATARRQTPYLHHLRSYPDLPMAYVTSTAP